MKKIKSIVDILKVVVKYGAYIMVIVDVVQYAIDKIEDLNKSKTDVVS